MGGRPLPPGGSWAVEDRVAQTEGDGPQCTCNSQPRRPRLHWALLAKLAQVSSFSSHQGSGRMRDKPALAFFNETFMKPPQATCLP